MRRFSRYDAATVLIAFGGHLGTRRFDNRAARTVLAEAQGTYFSFWMTLGYLIVSDPSRLWSTRKRPSPTGVFDSRVGRRAGWNTEDEGWKSMLDF
ncbi:MAG: hypothetical protein KJ065_14985 [Anaerolineae bacterium]|nr:hypothetical protein [Anaerolineae bacterium]